MAFKRRDTNTEWVRQPSGECGDVEMGTLLVRTERLELGNV